MLYWGIAPGDLYCWRCINEDADPEGIGLCDACRRELKEDEDDDEG